MSTATRVIKNTGYLYLRMGIVVFISLYSTRLVLASLGEADFGVFNVIGGSIAMMGFLNSTLANATQRFMSYAEGKGHVENKKKIFNVCLVLHLVIAVVTALLLISIIGLLFNDVLNIGRERIGAAKIIYYCLIFNTCLTIANVPYDAVLNAHENMLYYTVVGILETILKLGIAIICVYTTFDKLIVYGVLMAIVPLLTLTIMKVYCHKHYEECVIAPKRYWDGTILKQIVSFSGWNFLTAISSLFTVQGLGVVLNHFFGPILNAAQGIANQINGQLSAFSVNMMKALNPVIVKRAASNSMEQMNTVTLAGCKCSSYLLILLVSPFILRIDYILGLWLKEVPAWASVFCVMQLIHSVIVQMAQGVATSVYASGHIKQYAIYKSLMNILPLVITYFIFYWGGTPVWLYIPLIIFMGVCGDIVIIQFAHKECGLRIVNYLKEVCQPVLLTFIMMLLGGMLSDFILQDENFLKLIICGLLTTIGMLVSCFTFGLNKMEKSIVRNLVNSVISKCVK